MSEFHSGEHFYLIRKNNMTNTSPSLILPLLSREIICYVLKKNNKEQRSVIITIKLIK